MMPLIPTGSVLVLITENATLLCDNGFDCGVEKGSEPQADSRNIATMEEIANNRVLFIIISFPGRIYKQLPLPAN